MELVQIAEEIAKIKQNIEKVIVGKGDVIELVLTTMLANGHVLLEDVPGTGKTVLAKSLAKSIEGEFKRIQFTPDLLPSDVTGLSYFNQKNQEFVFRKGPAFSNVLLADEINRAMPRTQSSLLECMGEHQITVDGVTRVLEELFFVIATENPIETVGTYPLPEAQLDRFMMKLSVGFPDEKQEKTMLQRFLLEDPLEDLTPVCKKESIVDMQKAIKKVYVHESVQSYLLDIVRATRERMDVLAGVSPRGSLALLRCSQSYAAIQGRDYVVPEDVKYLAPHVLSHRIVAVNSLGAKKDNHHIISAIMEQVEVPTEKFQS